MPFLWCMGGGFGRKLAKQIGKNTGSVQNVMILHSSKQTTAQTAERRWMVTGMELNCTNCGEQSSCWYGQNKEPKKCGSYWNASSIKPGGEAKMDLEVE